MVAKSSYRLLFCVRIYDAGLTRNLGLKIFYEIIWRKSIKNSDWNSPRKNVNI
jgi:hypothetical protein